MTKIRKPRNTRRIRVFRGPRAMILAEIKQYFQQHKSVSLQQLTLHFQSEPEAMRDMLAHWIRKGKVRKEIVNGVCRRCSECHVDAMEIYKWLV